MMKRLIAAALLVFSCMGAARAAVTDWTDFKLDSGHISFSGKVMDEDVEIIIDSGAGINGISLSLVMNLEDRLHHSEQATIQGVFGTERKNVYNQVPVELFGVETRIDRLAEFRSFNDLIILGLGFFDQFIVQLDYPNRRMRLIGRDSIDLAEFDNVPIDRQRDSGLPVVRVTLPGDIDAWLTFDTGNSGGIIMDRAMALENGWLDEPGEAGVSMGVNRTATTEQFSLTTLKIGPYELENVRASVPGEGQNLRISDGVASGGIRGARRGRRSEGILGYDVLQHFVVTIDFRNNLLHLGLPDE